jgi:hypothetical protein
MTEFVWDSPEFFDKPKHVMVSPYGFHPSMSFNPFIERPKDNPEEALRLYKENYNKARADKEWEFLEKFCDKVYSKYVNLFNKTVGRILK